MPDYLTKNRYFTRRSFVFKGTQLIVLTAFTFRMFLLQIVDGQKYRALADGNKNRVFLERPLRGLIIDSDGVPVAGNELNYRVLIDIDRLHKGSVSEIAEVLSDIFGKEVDNSLLLRLKKKKSGIFVLYKKISWEDLLQMEVYAPNLRGVYVSTFYNRYYKFAESCAHITGYVKEESIESENRRLEIDKGVSGIELFYDETLRGIPGVSVCEVDAKGKNARELSKKESQKGSDVKLTVNALLQEEVYSLFEGSKGAAVIMEIATGNIILLCSSPSYDNNKFISGFSEQEWKDLSTSVDLHLLNRAISMPIQPASTFKTVTALAGLRAGIITPETKFRCEGGLQMGDHFFRCWKPSGHGDMNVRDAIINSCNVFFYELGKRLSLQNITDVASEFAMGEKFNIGLGVESACILPTKKWKYNNAIFNWNQGDTVNIAIGHGMVSVSVLHLAVQAARIASGRAVLPFLVEPEGERDFKKLNINEFMLDIIRESMSGVVNRGTASFVMHRGQRRFIDIAGKTGTAQSLKEGLLNHGLFMGYYPYRNPKYSAAVFCENSGGSGVAVSLFKRILSSFRNYYDV